MEQLRLNQFLNYRYISRLTANPSQTKMAFLLAKARLEKNDYAYELYESDGTRHQKLYNLEKTSGFIYETDQSILISLDKSKEDKKAKKELRSIYYRLNIESKKIEKAYEFPILVEIVEILDDHTLLLSAKLTDKQYALKDLNDEDRKKALEALKKDKNYEEINELPFYYNGPGFIANKKSYLMVYDIHTKAMMPIHKESVSPDSFKVDKVNKKIAYIGSKIQDTKPMTNQLYLYEYQKYIHHDLYTKDDYSIDQVLFVDDHLVVRASDMKDYGNNQNSDFFTVEQNTFKLLAKFDTGFGNSVGSDCRLGGSSSSFVKDHQLFFVATNDDHTDLMSLNLNGEIKNEYTFDGSIDGISLCKNEIYAIAQYKQKLQELFRIDLNPKQVRQISRYNQKVLREFYVAKPKEIVLKYPTHAVKGWVLLPKDYDPKASYPAILDIHGGPKTVYGKVFYHEMQVWANLGYIVFFCNPRGSDGKGNAFADIRGKYGTIDYDDIMAFTDKVIKKYPQIDHKRVFVTGGSYGGFMTNWIVGHTDRFKAAATQRSISNWLSFYGTSDIGFYFAKDQTGSHPNLDTEKMWEQSPLKYALNVKTPLLFIHSDQDYRCPIEQAMQFYAVIKERNVPSRFVWFKEETHELSRSGKPQGRVKRLEEITNWFESYR